MATAEEIAAEAAAAAAKKAADDAAAAAKAAEGDDEEDDLEDGEDDDDDSGLNKVDKIVKNLIEHRGGTYRKGSPEALVARKLVHDTFKLREKNSRLRARVVAPGDVILKKGTDADAWNVLQTLGIPAKDVKTKLQQRDDLEKKVRAYDRAQFFNDVADGLGYTGRGKKTFVRVAEKEGIDLQMKEVEIEVDGKKQKEMRPYAKLATESDDKLRPIEQYVDEELGDYLPAFMAEGSDDSDAGDRSDERRSHAEQRKQGVPMVNQSGSSSRKADDKKTAKKAAETFVASTYDHLRAKPAAKT